MGFVEWATLSALATFLLGFGGWVWRLADRINKSESKAETAAITASAAKLRADMIENQLNDHRIAVAKEYVSRVSMEALENKLIDAITRLGDRLDNLFMRAQGQS